jgi:beta-lactamase class D
LFALSRIALTVFLLAAAAPATAQDAPPLSCVIIQELNAGQPLVTRGEGCATRLSPASTFKIPHALVALETGVVTPDSIEKWDGTKYPRQRKWNQDHTVISALKPSVLWFFQRIAPRIGAARMTEWLAKFKYGNGDVSGPITEYWINGRLQVSVPEQVAFLRAFYRRGLPVQPRYQELVRAGLDHGAGTIENSLGVQRLKGDWRQARLNAKTGATSTGKYRVSWLVGSLRANEREYVFASAVWRAGGEVDTLDAAHLAVRTFIDAGLLPRGR